MQMEALMPPMLPEDPLFTDDLVISRLSWLSALHENYENLLRFLKLVRAKITTHYVEIIIGFHHSSGVRSKSLSQRNDTEHCQVEILYAYFLNHVYQHVCISAYVVCLWLWLFTGKKLWLKQTKCRIWKEIFGNWRVGRQENEGTIAKTTCSARSPKDKYLISMSNIQIDTEVIFCSVSLFLKMQEAVIFSP